MCSFIILSRRPPFIDTMAAAPAPPRKRRGSVALTALKPKEEIKAQLDYSGMAAIFGKAEADRPFITFLHGLQQHIGGVLSCVRRIFILPGYQRMEVHEDDGDSVQGVCLADISDTFVDLDGDGIEDADEKDEARGSNTCVPKSLLTSQPWTGFSCPCVLPCRTATRP